MSKYVAVMSFDGEHRYGMSAYDVIKYGESVPIEEADDSHYFTFSVPFHMYDITNVELGTTLHAVSFIEKISFTDIAKFRDSGMRVVYYGTDTAKYRIPRSIFFEHAKLLK